MTDPVIMFVGANDRAIITCLRSLCARDIPVILLAPLSDRFNPFQFTKYRSLIARQFRFPSPDDSTSFLGHLDYFLARHRNVRLFPTGEKIIRLLHRDLTMLSRHGAILCTATPDSYALVSDKLSFAQLCPQFGIKVPTVFAAKPGYDDLPFVLKPKAHCKQAGDKPNHPILVLDSKQYEACEPWLQDDNYFAQSYLEGESFYYCAAYSDGNRKAAFTQRNICQQPGGKSIVKAAPGDLPDSVKEKIDALMAAQNWSGLMMFELRRVGHEFYGIEINPRLWGPVQLALDNGIDFPRILYQIFAGIETPADTDAHKRSETEPRGYLWLGGYLQGLLMQLSGYGRFQRFGAQKEVSFQDVWLRRDSCLAFCFDMVFVVMKFILGCLKRGKKF